MTGREERLIKVFEIVTHVISNNHSGLGDEWITMTQKDNPIPYNLDRFPLEIQTSAMGSNVWLQGTVDDSSSPLPSYSGIKFSISWRKSDNSVWLANHHTGYGEEFLLNGNCWTAGTWRIFKLKRKLVISCEKETVYEVFYKDLFDSNTIIFQQRSATFLSKEVTHIWFHSSDSATEAIKPTGKNKRGGRNM